MFSQAHYHSTITLNRSIAQNILIVILANVLLAFASQFALHLWWPVPITLQSAMVVLLGLTLGSKRAAAAVAMYLVEGAAGLPVFAGGLSGFSFLVGASGGYLWGFLPAAFLAGFLMEQGLAKNIFTTFFAALSSSSVIFLLGVSHLAMLLGWEKAYAFGLQPFLIIEPIKLAIASVIALFCWKDVL